MTAETVEVGFEREDINMLALTEVGVNSAIGMIRADMATELDENVRQSMESLISLLERGGKRTRGRLAQVGYLMYGGADRNVMAAIAGAVEVMHAFLLTVDDIADESETRREGPAVHIDLRNYFLRKGFSEEVATKKGTDMATTAAITAGSIAREMILGLEDVPDKNRNVASRLLEKGLKLTGYGQLRDMAPKDYKNVDKEAVLQTTRDKTAYYSFLLPLQIGAALAGATSDQLEDLRDYAINAGIAFQFIDDIISTFGEEDKIGKSPKTDAQEGTVTYMLALALEYASENERRALISTLGRVALDEEGFSTHKSILEETGALDQTGREAWRYLGLAQRAIRAYGRRYGIDDYYIKLLRDLAKGGVKRAA